MANQADLQAEVNRLQAENTRLHYQSQQWQTVAAAAREECRELLDQYTLLVRESRTATFAAIDSLVGKFIPEPLPPESQAPQPGEYVDDGLDWTDLEVPDGMVNPFTAQAALPVPDLPADIIIIPEDADQDVEPGEAWDA